jgi:DNA (cytosine-5)-methyltransferase 1
MIKVGSDFSGVGAFNQALQRLGIDYKEVFACDMDKYARQTFIHNYGEPEYYPMNVYDREIPSESLDIYMTSPPCQAFSLAGKRLGKDDKRGILFFNSHEFIQKNQPRYFIFENVKGLLSDDGGKTFQEWINMLGGKSVNGIPVLFPYEDSVDYHIYYKVLNAKHHGVPQNRERVFIIGIRDDHDNVFQFPKEEHLTKRLKDVLELDVDDKYFLSEEKLLSISKWNSRQNPIRDNMYEGHEIASCLLARGDGNEHGGMKLLKIGYINQDTQASAVYSDNGLSQTMTAGTHGYAMGYIQVKSATSKGYEEAKEGDSINFSVPNSETRRGRVGKGVAQTLDTACNQGIIIPLFHWGKGKNNERMVYDKEGISPCMTSAMGMGGGYTPSVIKDYKIRRLTPRECFRLMDFPDTFTWPVSDSQAYKQAGNSIVVGVLAKIISKLKL